MKSKQTINFSFSHNLQTFIIFLSHLSLILCAQLVQVEHHKKDGDDMKHKKLLFITILFLFCAILIGWKSVSYKNDSDTSETKESMQSRIKKIYNVENQSKIASSLNKEKLNPTYAEDNMFVKYNPYGTNTQSLYVYFTTEDAVKVSYTVHVDDSVISDFTRNVAQSSTYQTTHEFQLIGLIPNSINEITITLTKKDGSSVKKTMNYELDWMHINTIQYTKDDSLILSSRETSSIIKLKSIFSEYDSDHKKIASFKMNIEKYIYRVYKYDFDGFCFSS